MDVDITYKEEEWEAIHDHMGKQLHVHGVCHIRGGGFAAGLEPHEKPLPNPMMLPLDLVVHATGETPSSVPVDWKQPWMTRVISTRRSASSSAT
jgi:hypothetical protein